MGKEANESDMSTEEYKYINTEYICDIADGDNDFVAEIIGNCLETLGPNMKQLSEAIATSDQKTTIFLTHKLKGSFRFIGCNEEGNLIEQMENLAVSSSDTVRIKEIMQKVLANFNNIENELAHFLKSIS